IDSLADDYKLTDANVGPEATDSDGVSLHDHGLNSNGHRVAEVYTEEFHVNPGQTVMDIDVGLKNEAPGSISGTVFCDIDCDGIQDKEIIGGEGFDKKSGYIITNGVPGGLKAVELHSGRKAGATLEATEIGPDATFSAWARFDTTHNNYQRIFDFSNGATHDNILLTQVGRTDDMMFEVYDSSNGHNVKLIVRDVIKVGEWANWTVTDNLKITATVAETSIAEEPGKDGVTVMLLNADGTPVLDADGNPITTVTDADGDYSFDGVLAGDYRVKVTAPDGFAFTDQNVGSDDTVDSDVNDAGVSDVISVGEDVTDVDAGLKDKPAPLPGSLSGTYFCDEDRDGTDSAGDTDVAGKTVMLFLADGVTPATDIDGNPVANAVTDANGDYSFTNLAAGDYVVMFEATDGKSFIAANQGSDADDSDVVDLANGKTAPVTVVAGQTTENVDAGVATDNQAPVATDDAGEGCAEDDIVVDLSDNYSDADSASVSISSIGGVAIADGQTVTIDGVNITLSGDSFIFDGEMELSDLDIGESETRSYDYHVVDSDGATATASIDVKFCGDANTASSLLDTFDFFGEYQVRAGNQPDPLNPDPSAIDIKLSGIGVDARLDGQVFDAYCLSFFDPAGSSADFDTAPFQTANVFSAESAQVNNVFEPGQVGSFNNQSAADNLDLIKWIVAQDYEGQGFTGWEVQFAIWELTDINKTNDDGSPFDPRALLDAFPTYGESDNLDFILAEAAANGEGFDFDLNGHVGLIVDPDPVTDTNSQPFIIAFDPEDYDCIC
ncbi:MAG: hypothetical protein OIF48_13795, partial [Silicimonas sp.]|nr:hypothetical protein [Silicimonas sp.]